MGKIHEKPLADTVTHIFERLTNPTTNQNTALVDAWRSAVGSDLVKHTKPRFGKKGQVIVWVDDSTLASELNIRFRHNILKRLQAELGKAKVTQLQFFVGELH